MAKKPLPLEKTSASLFDNIGQDKGTPLLNDDQTLASSGKKNVSVWALVSFVLGILGFFSLVHLGFLVCSAIALFSAIVAFVTIARSGGELEGKKFAAFGLALAIASAIAGQYSAYVYERDFNRQADEFIRLWFEDVKSDNIALAYQTTEPYWQRAAFVTHDDVLSFWRRRLVGEEEEHFATHSYLSNPTLLTINYLGDRAKLSYYGTFYTILTNSTEQTERVYAVTVEPEEPGGKTQTFFLGFVVERIMRKTPEGQTLIGWMMHASDLIPLEVDSAGRPVRPK